MLHTPIVIYKWILQVYVYAIKTTIIIFILTETALLCMLTIVNVSETALLHMLTIVNVSETALLCMLTIVNVSETALLCILQPKIKYSVDECSYQFI